MFWDVRLVLEGSQVDVAPEEVPTPMHSDDVSDIERVMVTTPASAREEEVTARRAAASVQLTEALETEMPDVLGRAKADADKWQFWSLASDLGQVRDVVALRTAYAVSEVQEPETFASFAGVNLTLQPGAMRWTQMHPDEVEERVAADPQGRGIVLADEALLVESPSLRADSLSMCI
jgi:hypothetical protein